MESGESNFKILWCSLDYGEASVHRNTSAHGENGVSSTRLESRSAVWFHGGSIAADRSQAAAANTYPGLLPRRCAWLLPLR